MTSMRELRAINLALDARKEADEVKRKVAADQMQAAEDGKQVRQARRETLVQKQEARAQLQQQQAQALEATRAIQKATAAAARRATVEKNTLAVSAICLHQVACQACHHSYFTKTRASFSTLPIVAC